MATIRDVAELAGVSITTVSFVLNGKAREKKIAVETCQRIEQAMNTLGYHPNLSARRLRSSSGSKPVIAIYWPLDYRINTLAHFINAMQFELHQRSFACDFVIQTYESNSLSKSVAPLTNSEYTAALLGGLGKDDLEFLKTVPLPIPVVLVNRYLEKLSTVGVNNRSLVEKAVSLFEEKGYRQLGVICSRNLYYATNQRTEMFISSCAGRGIDIPAEWIIRTENRIDGGVRAGQRFGSFSARPKAIFCDSDAIAYGFISYCNRHGIRIPQEMELLCIGSMFDNAYSAYATPSISSISLPHSRIAMSAISLLIDALVFGSNKPVHKLIEPEVHLRESFHLD